ncbi:hypothetical protein PUN28_001680 [Cardiocondyla obscurior]|uniref:Uncharacterized protein n=1 Tax=Cardiocondyla obscurior TaxID=286306 RepID=A0AAW2GQQ0_9HYME
MHELRTSRKHAALILMKIHPFVKRGEGLVALTHAILFVLFYHANKSVRKFRLKLSLCQVKPLIQVLCEIVAKKKPIRSLARPTTLSILCSHRTIYWKTSILRYHMIASATSFYNAQIFHGRVITYVFRIYLPYNFI